MKTLWFAAFVLAATAAFGQSASVLSSQASPIQIQDHPEHASQSVMAEEQYISATSCYPSAHGERPLWEVAPPPRVEKPLGDVAREVRKQREVIAVKKAGTVLEN